MKLRRPLRLGLLRLSLLAIAVGIITGFGAVAFRALIGLIHNIAFLGSFSIEYDASVFTPPSPWGALIILVQPARPGNTPRGENPMRLALADDSWLFRSSLTLLLEASGAEVTASRASGVELLAAIRTNPPDAAILDIRMPPSFTDKGISTAAELRRLYPRVGILVLSTYAETSYAGPSWRPSQPASATC